MVVYSYDTRRDSNRMICTSVLPLAGGLGGVGALLSGLPLQLEFILLALAFALGLGFLAIGLYLKFIHGRAFLRVGRDSLDHRLPWSHHWRTIHTNQVAGIAWKGESDFGVQLKSGEVAHLHCSAGEKKQTADAIAAVAAFLGRATSTIQ